MYIYTCIHVYMYIAKVKAKHKEAILCYVEVVLHFVTKVPSQSCSCAIRF